MNEKFDTFRKEHFPTVAKHVDDLKAYLQNASIVDIGSNIGLFSLAVHQALPYRSLTLFEPCADYFDESKRLLCDAHDVAFHNVALSDKNEDAVIYKSSDSNIGWNTMLREDPNQRPGFFNQLPSEQITVKRLDDFLFDNLNFIKIDVEGFEYKVLEGGWGTLRRHLPHLFIEVGWGTSHPHWHEARKTYERLFQVGYHPVEFTSQSADVLFVPACLPGASIVFPW